MLQTCDIEACLRLCIDSTQDLDPLLNTREIRYLQSGFPLSEQRPVTAGEVSELARLCPES
jgi:hypothetical protein